MDVRQTEGVVEQWITIGELAQRAGLAASAIRFYERVGLIAAAAHPGGPAPVPP